MVASLADRPFLFDRSLEKRALFVQGDSADCVKVVVRQQLAIEEVKIDGVAVESLEDGETLRHSGTREPEIPREFLMSLVESVVQEPAERKAALNDVELLALEVFDQREFERLLL